MNRNQAALTTNNSAMLLYGLSAVLIGPTLPGMIAGFDLSLSQGGLIGSAQNIGGFAGALITIWIGERLPRAATALGSFLLLAFALLGVSFAGSYLPLLVLFAATGVFIRFLDVMLNAHTGEIAGARSGRQMSLLHMFFSIGAFVGPLVARAIMTAGATWFEVYRYVGIGYIAVALASSWWLRSYVRPDVSVRAAADADDLAGARAAAVPAGMAPAAGPTAGSAAGRAAGRRVVLLGAALFFYAVHQIGVTSWVPYFLENVRGADATVASLGLSLYWVGIIVGRFVSSRIVERTGVSVVLLAGSFVAAAATVAAVAIPHVVASQLLLTVAGMTSGATIPLAYSLGFTVVPAQTARVTALMSAIMLAGRFLSPWAIGAVADATSLVAAMMIPGVALVATGTLAWSVVRRSRR